MTKLWRSMETAPVDEFVMLLIDLSGLEKEEACSMQDTSHYSMTIGICVTDDAPGERAWNFVGWQWEHDVFLAFDHHENGSKSTYNGGKPIAWHPIANQDLLEDEMIEMEKFTQNRKT